MGIFLTDRCAKGFIHHRIFKKGTGIAKFLMIGELLPPDVHNHLPEIQGSLPSGILECPSDIPVMQFQYRVLPERKNHTGNDIATAFLGFKYAVAIAEQAVFPLDLHLPALC
jgi:hypothetical protein